MALALVGAMDNDAQQNFDLVRDLRRAIAKNELELYFQPKIDARSGHVTGSVAPVCSARLMAAMILRPATIWAALISSPMGSPRTARAKTSH